MEIKNLLSSLIDGEEAALEGIYLHFRPSFMSWMHSAHKNDKEIAVETYKYAITSFYEALMENAESFKKENDIKLYLFSVAKNRLLSENKNKNHLSYQSDLEEEVFQDQDEKVKRVEKLKNLVSVQGYPCKNLLKYHYFNRFSNDKISAKLDYNRSEAIEELKDKCVNRILKLLTVASEEI